MKKQLAVISLVVVLSISLFGCGSKSDDSNASVDGNNNVSDQNSNAQRQFNRADLSGEVSGINGSDITIKVIESPMGNGRNRNGQGNNNPNNNNNQNDNNQNNSPDNNNQNNNNQGNRKSGGNWKNGGNPQGSPIPPRQREVKYTGETKTINVPSGIEITMMTMGDNGPNTEQLELKDIKVGDTLQIWYSDKEKQTISRLRINRYNR